MIRSTRKPKMILSPHQCAEESIGLLTPGIGITAVTKGQYSLLDLIRAVAAQTGRADLTVSTWSTGIRETGNIGIMIDSGLFRRVRLCLDRSFAGRQPKYMEDVIRVWGEENIRMTRNHAKFFMVRNECWNICVRSSMNLNRNPRLEQFDLDDSVELCDYFEKIIDEIFEMMPAGLERKTKKCDEVFPELIGGGLSDQYSVVDLRPWQVDLKAMLSEFND